MDPNKVPTETRFITEKPQKQLIRKSLIAVENVLENIAPGQVHQLKKAFSETPSSDLDLTRALQSAVGSATSVENMRTPINIPSKRC